MSAKPYYESGGVTIYHGDCREILPAVTADVMVTDPPYGMSLSSGRGGEFGDLSITNDHDLGARDAALSLWGDRPALVFGRWSEPYPDSTKAVLIWEKGLDTGMGDLSLPWKPNWEQIYVLGRGFHGPRGSGVLRARSIPIAKSHGRLHPTQKPVDLLCMLIEKCPRGIVLDPFAGSGSTLKAAKKLGRVAIGIEIEERYCEVAARELSQDYLDFTEVA